MREMCALDKKDRRILLELDTDAKQSLAQIAHKLHTTKEVVNYRIKQLEQKGIISNYYALMQFAKLGLTYYKLYIKFSHITRAQKEEMIKYLQNKVELGWLASCEGAFDFIIAIPLSSVFEFERFRDEFFSRFDGMFHKVCFAVMTDGETYPRQYITGKSNPAGRFFAYNEPAEKAELDSDDSAILKAIWKSGKAPAVEISKMTGLTERIVRYRRKSLEKDGVIVGSKLALNYRKLGHMFFKCFIKSQHLTQNRLLGLKAYARQHPNIVDWSKVLGEWDIELEIEVPSIHDFYRISNEIRHKFSDVIQTFDSVLVSEEHVVNWT